MIYYEQPFSDKAMGFISKHTLIVYISVVVTVTLAIVFLQILGVHK